MIILVLLIVVHFFSLSYLVVQTAELLPLDQYRSQYPYDVIWITEKDNKGYAKKLASTYNGTVTEVPMIRVSTYYGQIILEFQRKHIENFQNHRH